FQTASDENAVIMFDECDSLLYNREAVGMIMASEINCILGEIENFKGVVIMTTNRLGKLDPALQRRIIAKVELPLPEKEQRVQIWKNLLPTKMPIDDNVVLEDLAKEELSGGEIKNAILLAARKAIARNEDSVKAKHFVDAIRSILAAKREFESNKPSMIGISQSREFTLSDAQKLLLDSLPMEEIPNA
ncbi:unnamed protein product, partial [marine sediment metagenome]